MLILKSPQAFWFKFLLSVTFLFLLQPLLYAEPIAKKGVLDLRQWDFHESGYIDLKGDWEIYLNHYIQPGQFEQYQNIKGYIKVPGSWHQLLPTHQLESFQHFATYRLSVLTSNKSDLLALNIVHIMTNFDLYVNGKLVSNFGDLYDDENNTPDKRYPILISEPFTGDKLEIVVHVSNYETYQGGIFRSIFLGNYQDILKHHMIRLGKELLLIGSILIIGLYHFGIYYFRRKDKAALFFGILCLLIALRTFFMGSRFAAVLMPNLYLSFTLTIEFVSLYLLLGVFATFFYFLFPKDFSPKVLKLMCACSISMALLALRIYQTIEAHTHFIFESIGFISLGYFVYVLYKALKRKREGAKIILFGFIFILITSINDALYGYHLISSIFLLPLGLFIYIVLQAFHLSRQTATSLNRIEDLSVQLTEMNLNLENTVRGRTEELRLKNDQLRVEILEHTKTAKQLEESKKQAENANSAKTEFLANVSHELRTPMHGILGFTKLGRARAKILSREKITEYFSEIHRSASRLLKLLNDLLDLSKLEAGKTDYNFQYRSLHETIETVNKELSVIATNKKVQIIYSKPEFDDNTLFDFDKIIQVVRNLLSNAIKFSTPDSIIEIDLKDCDIELELSIKDHGVGIPEGELDAIFDKFIQSSMTKTGAGGTGLGLAISKQIVNDHHGRITATNAPEGGAVFTFSLPKIKGENPN